MNEYVKTEKCTNCGIEILSNNYIIHSIHCQRNFFMCLKCQRPVRYSQKDEHNAIDHAVINCTNCCSQLEKWYLNSHLQNDCLYRTVKCQICDIDVRADGIVEHEDYCGSRTEKCLKCKEFVMLKYKSMHIDSNHIFFKLSDEPGPSPSWHRDRRMLGDFIPDLTSVPQKLKSKKKKKHK